MSGAVGVPSRGLSLLLGQKRRTVDSQHALPVCCYFRVHLSGWTAHFLRWASIYYRCLAHTSLQSKAIFVDLITKGTH